MKRQPAFRLPVGPDDLVRHALAAYYRAVGDATAPIGEPHPQDWSDPEIFMDTLIDFFGLRVRYEASMAGFSVEADHARYLAWANSKPYGQMHVSELGLDETPGAGAEPLRYAAKDGGAVPAVGPALTGLQTGRGTPSEEPAFSGASRQTLPVAPMLANVDHD
ncbi:hypothetical protein LVB87_12225 [Lysobacter sp. KIS68-7]|uniref:hypothetical protein n=1 Tax=Lysobacter sp. KIS68-7 TaxID=2904252 RepID=UPI001E3E3D49|nr:hypothetical protein [Lysobacter sp. KIS68-7]UHQ18945.1 hypothetical protein LVB87_12225 [Lysobacter sp. KIS68-7]